MILCCSRLLTLPYGRGSDRQDRSLTVAALIGTEAGKEAVLPVLLEGTPESAFPMLLQGRVYGDFRKVETYFDTVFDLIWSLYRVPPQHAVVKELRSSLRG